MQDWNKYTGKPWMRLVQERADTRMKAAALADRTDLSAAETTEFNELSDRLTELNAEIDAGEIVREQMRTAPAAENMAGPITHERAPARRGHTYAEMFGQPPAMESWRDKEEFFSTVGLGLAHEALVPMATATTGMGSDGGFSVPEPLVAAMLDAALEDEIVRPRANVIPMTSSTQKVWALDVSDSSDTLFGGFAGAWVPEGDEITAEAPKLRMNELKANKLGILAQVSNELVSDGLGYTEQLESALVKAISWYMDYYFLRGSGAGQPRGVLNDAALIAVPKTGGQTAATITYENLAEMENRIHPAVSNKAIYVAAPGTRSQLLQLSIPVGIGGTGVAVLEGGPGQYTLLKRRVVFTEKLPQLGAQGDILLADFSQYDIGLRKEMSLDRSAQAGFTRDTTYFRAILRGDGQGKWSSAYTPKSGSSLSWCVTLAQRA